MWRAIRARGADEEGTLERRHLIDPKIAEHRGRYRQDDW
jgi:hypothetical protein